MADPPPKQESAEARELLRRAASKPSQSLGKWIDNLLGDRKVRERARLKAAERRKFFSHSP